MKKLITWLLLCFVLSLALVPAKADLAITNLTGFNVASQSSVPTAIDTSITFVACTSDTADLTTYTFSSASIGVADTTRTLLVIAVVEDDATIFDISSMTVAGSSATILRNQNNGTSLMDASLFAIANATESTTADIVVVANEAVTGATICVWAANNINVATDQFYATGGNPVATNTVNINSPTEALGADGAGIMMCAKQLTGESFTSTWDGPTENTDVSNADFAYAAYTLDGTINPDASATCSWTTATSGILINSIFSSSLASAVPTLTFVACTTSDVSGSQTTFSGASVSTAADNRTTLVLVSTEDAATNFGTSTVTVGGASANETTDEGGSGFTNASTHYVYNTAGTAEDIVVNATESVGSTVICVWAAYGLLTADTNKVANNWNTSSGSFTLTQTSVSEGSLTVGICNNAVASQTTTWGVITEQTDASTAKQSYSAAHTSNHSAGTKSNTCDYTGASDSAGAVMTLR